MYTVDIYTEDEEFHLEVEDLNDTMLHEILNTRVIVAMNIVKRQLTRSR